MASKNIPDRNKPAPGDKAPNSRGELEGKDLDKVTGGMRPTSIGNTKEPLAGG
jgi:hypothetical protein